MKKTVTALSLLMASLPALAQQPGSTQWSASAQRSSKPGEYVVALKGVVEKGWHVYGTTQSDGGPLPLVIRVDQGAPYALSGAITGSKPTKHHDASFNLDTEYFTDAFLLNVPVKTTANGSDEVPIAIRFQMCSDTICMPPRTVHLVAKVS
ncbi:MAG TPA: protein-disulfide reductase DsbD domain-containing protein [Terriglobus sp.]